MTAARRMLALAAVAVLGGCAMGGGPLEDNSPGVVRPGTITPAAAQAAVRAGQSKAQVVATLGRANGVAFDSGWEVWVYRWLGPDRTAQGAREFVVLFDASGVLKKTRAR